MSKTAAHSPSSPWSCDLVLSIWLYVMRVHIRSVHQCLFLPFYRLLQMSLLSEGDIVSELYIIVGVQIRHTQHHAYATAISGSSSMHHLHHQ
jgi:hypothetical protein